MSEYTKCNYCVLKSLRRHAKSSGEKIVLVGKTAYRIPKEMNESDFMKLRDEPFDSDPLSEPNRDVGESKYFVAWFMDLPDHCCC